MMLNEDFNMDLLTPEDGASRKRKSSDDESPIPQKCPRVSVIVPNPNVPQVGNGKVEPEKEKNLQPEDTGRAQEQNVGLDSPPVLLLEDSNINVSQVGTGKVEPEKEKNPQPEDTGRAQEQDVGLDSPPVLLPEE